MAKKTPAQLRAEARRLLERAKQLEQRTAIMVGQYVIRLAEKDFEGVTFEELKETIKKMLQ